MSSRKKNVHGTIELPTWRRVRQITPGELCAARWFADAIGIRGGSDVAKVSLWRQVRSLIMQIDSPLAPRLVRGVENITAGHNVDGYGNIID